jgi:hypothetical protein
MDLETLKVFVGWKKAAEDEARHAGYANVPGMENPFG